MIGAEVEHEEKGSEEKPEAGSRSRPIGSAVEGLARRTPPVTGYRTARRLIGAGRQATGRRTGFFWALRRLSPPSRKISEFSTSRSAMAVAMVVLKRMLPQSENAVLVVIMVDSLLAVARGDDLVKEVRGLLIERQVAKLVTDEQGGIGIDLELADQRVIDLRSEQMIQHVHGGGEQDRADSLGRLRQPMILAKERSCPRRDSR